MKWAFFNTSGDISSSSPTCSHDGLPGAVDHWTHVKRYAYVLKLLLSPKHTVQIYIHNQFLWDVGSCSDETDWAISWDLDTSSSSSRGLKLTHGWSKSHSLTSNHVASQKQSREKDSGVLNPGLSLIYYHFYLLGVSLISARLSPN